MLQGQKFQYGNYKLQNLMEAQTKYRQDTAHRTGRPLEDIVTPFDEQIGRLEEDLNDSEAEYKLSQENPITQSYKNKVKGLAGLGKPEQNLEEDVASAPDLETEMNNALAPQQNVSQAPSAYNQQPNMSVEPTLGGPTEDTSQTRQLIGKDIQPDDTTQQYLPYGRAAIEQTTPGHSVLAQADARLQKKQRAGDQVPGAIGQAEDPGAGLMSVGQPADMEGAAPTGEQAPLNTDYMSEVADMPYAPPPVDKEADLMLKNLDLIKAPPLKFKPDVFKGPIPEQYKPDMFLPADRLGIVGKQMMDWGEWLNGGKTFGDRGDRYALQEANRLDKYVATQKAGLKEMEAKNRQSNNDAFTKFQYDQNIKFKMASLDQQAQEKAQKFKIDMLKLSIQKNKGRDDYKEAYKQGNAFHKLDHVSKYPERVDAFRNAMSAPPTGSGDKDIIENLVKFIDPKGVIREGKVKFMTAALKSFSLNPDGTINADKLDRYMHVGLKGGFLTPEDRKELLEATIPMMQNFTRTYQHSYDQYKAIFMNRGWDANLLTPFEMAVASQEQYEAARNKINADYMATKKDIQGQLETRSKNPNVLENKIKSWLPQSLQDYANPSGVKEQQTNTPSLGDELKNKYGP